MNDLSLFIQFRDLHIADNPDIFPELDIIYGVGKKDKDLRRQRKQEHGSVEGTNTNPVYVFGDNFHEPPSWVATLKSSRYTSQYSKQKGGGQGWVVKFPEWAHTFARHSDDASENTIACILARAAAEGRFAGKGKTNGGEECTAPEQGETADAQGNEAPSEDPSQKDHWNSDTHSWKQSASEVRQTGTYGRQWSARANEASHEPGSSRDSPKYSTSETAHDDVWNDSISRMENGRTHVGLVKLLSESNLLCFE